MGAPLVIALAISAHLSAAISTGAGDSQDVVRRAILVDGEDVLGRLVSLDAAGQLVIVQEGEEHNTLTHELALDDFVLWGAPVDPPAFSRLAVNESARIILASGGFITADLIACDMESVKTESRLLGAVEIPLSQIAAILLAPPTSAKRCDELVATLLERDIAADQLGMTNGDAITGAITAIDIDGANSTIALENDGRRLSIPFTNVNAITFDPRTLNARQSAERYRIGFSDGSLVNAAEFLIENGKATFTPFSGTTWSAAAEKTVYVDYANPRVNWLEDRVPDQYQHVPFLTGEWDWLPKRNALGGQLRCEQQRFAHGLGTHSASQLTYALREPVTRFQAEIALDDVSTLGSVVFRVVTFHRLEGETVRKERFVSPIIRNGDAPIAVSIDLDGAVGIRLIVDFGESGDQQDYANWLNARLIRAVD